MKPRTVICVLTIVFMLAYTVPSSTTLPPVEEDPADADYSAKSIGYGGLAQAGGTGDSLTGTAFMSRTLTGQHLDILNAYRSPNVHAATLDLTGYRLSGWTMYNATIDMQALTATSERAVVGTTGQSWGFAITRYTVDFVNYYHFTSLTQGFYDKAHSGKLANYSLFYDSPTYEPSTYGTAYFVIRADYDTSSSNVTVPVAITNNGGTAQWVVKSATPVLSADTQYFLVIDGSSLSEVSEVYPWIRWRAETSSGSFDTYRYDDQPVAGWRGPLGFESLMNYTYTPWNTTASAPLDFSDPASIALRANYTALSGTRWSFETPDTSIKQIRFDTNLSVSLGYNITLYYSKPVTTSTVWDIPDSGLAVTWNQTFVLSYPSVATGTVSRYVNLTCMSDWSPTGLYAGTSQIDHDSYIASGKTVTCALMTDGTWTMVYSGYNYAVSVSALGYVSMEGTLTITSLFQDEWSRGVTTGSSNLTVWRGSTMLHNPANTTTPEGIRVYDWVVDSEETVNGIHRIEVYWSNGTEAGYRTANTVVYYPTELTTSTPSVGAFTNSSFSIRAYYNDTHTPQPLTGAVADVTYSFDSGPSTPMTDLLNGTWTAVVSTVSKTAGTYLVNVSASGWALQNRSLLIPVTLTYDTLPLSMDWTGEDNITYVESATLYVFYRFANGTSVPYANLNVTDGITVWSLSWSSLSGTYNYTFHGSDIQPGIGIHSLTVNAWRVGHEAQVDSSQTLIVTEEPTTLSIAWSPSSSITYINSTTLVVNYRMSNSTNILGATVTATIGVSSWPLHWSGSAYVLQFNGTDAQPSWGTYTVAVQASLTGYVDEASDTSLTKMEEPTSLVFGWTTWTIDWTESVIFTVDYTDSHGTLIPGATQRQFGVNGSMYVLVDSSGVYSYTIDSSFDLGLHTVFVNISKFGYEYAYYSAVDFTIIRASTTLVVTWSPANVTIDYTQFLNLTVEYKHSGSYVPSAVVNVTLDGHVYPLVFTGTDWRVSIPGADLGIGEFQAFISAWRYGYVAGENTTSNVNIVLAANSFYVTWEPSGIDMTYAERLNITVIYTYNYLPVPDAYVRLVINGTRVYDMNFDGNEWYLSLSGGEIDLGAWNLTVIANRTGYDTGVTDRVLSVNRAAYETYSWDRFYFGFDNATWGSLYHDGWVRVWSYCRDSEGDPLPGITATITIDSTEYAMEGLLNGTYVYVVSGYDLGVGNHVCSINFTSHGYNPEIILFEMMVQIVPTHIDTNIMIPTTMYLNQTVIILVDYINNHTGSPIASGPPVVSWSSSIIEAEFVSTGRYQIELSSYGLLLVGHELTITFAHANFTTRQLIQTIAVRAVHTSFVAEALSDTYEYEYVWLRVTYLDLDHGVPIHWALVNATIQGTVYQLQYVGGGVYAYHFNATIAPSTAYTVEYVASAYGCDLGATSAMLEVLAKAHTYINIDSFTPIQDELCVLGAYVRRNITETPLDGVTLTFLVITQLQNGTIRITLLSDVTNAEGYASQALLVHLEAAYLTVFVIYEGAETLWRAISSSGLLQVQRLSVLTLIVRILSQPIMLMTLTTIVGLVVAARAYNRSSKPKKARARKALEDQMRAFRDLTTLRHFMAVYLHRGTCVFYHPFAEQRIQPDLISGFIAAVTSVYGEIKGDGVQGTLEEIHYHGLRLNSYSGKYVIGILILEGEMTAYLRECLQTFIESFETRYASDLDGWTGLTDCFDNAWIVSSLYSAFGYTRLLPHTISRGRRPKGFDATVYKTIQQIMGSQKEFLWADMLVPVAKKVGKTELEVLDSLVRLAELHDVTPIETSVAVARQAAATTRTLPPSEERLVSEEVEVTAAKAAETSEVMPAWEEPRLPEETITSEARPVEEPTVSGAPGAPTLTDADRFLMEVESLLVKKAEEMKPGKKAEETEPDKKVEETKPDKKAHDADQFVKDIESLLTDEKEKKHKTRRKPTSE